MQPVDFRFKQFAIAQGSSAMKLGAEAVAFGACIGEQEGKRTLDIGAGTGILSLIYKQYNPKAHITAIEVDEDAAAACGQNVAQSPWPHDIEVLHINALNYQGKGFDVVLSNPPYFDESRQSDNPQRALARHEGALSYGGLFARSAQWLKPDGRLFLIIPVARFGEVMRVAITHLWYAYWQVAWQPKPNRVDRYFVAFARAPRAWQKKTMTQRNERGQFTDEYRSLVSDLYLDL